MTERLTLETSRIDPAARDKVAGYHRALIEEIAQAVASEKVVVVGMAQNPHVKRARKALEDAGIAFRYLEYGSYFSEWRPRLAIKMWSGWSTFPQVFVRGTLVGGADETLAAIADGSLKTRLEA
jgi:glutaredoxin-related protein